jgi:hypothetical protein
VVYLLDLSGVYCEPVEPRLLRLLSQAGGEPLFYLSQAFYYEVLPLPSSKQRELEPLR